MSWAEDEGYDGYWFCGGCDNEESHCSCEEMEGDEDE